MRLQQVRSHTNSGRPSARRQSSKLLTTRSDPIKKAPSFGDVHHNGPVLLRCRTLVPF